MAHEPCKNNFQVVDEISSDPPASTASVIAKETLHEVVEP